MTVNGSSTGVTRNGQYFFDAFALTNTSTPAFASLNIADNGTNVPPPLPAFVAKTPETFGYDTDGNLTSDGRWNYAYDAENRLISMETIPAAVTAGVTRQLLTFAYDYLNRRVSKIVQSGWNGTTYTSTDLSRRFLYNGWNLVAETNHLSSEAILRNYFWGLDISGPGQGAGGVGGLLMIQDASTSYLPMYDGVGNVHGLINTGSVTFGTTAYPAGSIVAGYEYDAFGNTLRESGPYGATNPFQYSTKYTDIETGLICYGLRYYSPSTGRFINKDPIEEMGGLNLYGFCGNNGVTGVDYLGMKDYVGNDPATMPDWVKSILGMFIGSGWQNAILDANMYGYDDGSMDIVLLSQRATDYQNQYNDRHSGNSTNTGAKTNAGSKSDPYPDNPANPDPNTRSTGGSGPGGTQADDSGDADDIVKLENFLVVASTSWIAGDAWNSVNSFYRHDIAMGRHNDRNAPNNAISGHFSGMVIQVTLQNGHSVVPMTRMKHDMAQTIGAREDTLTPFFYPTNKTDPQRFLDVWKVIDALVRSGSIDPLTANGMFLGTWTPGGENNWKNDMPFGVYDGAANFMFGATGAIFGYSLDDLWRIGDGDHYGNNSAVNDASIASGYYAAAHGGTLSLVPYTLNW